MKLIKHFITVLTWFYFISDIFKIDRKSGELKLKSVVDAERSQDYHFDVVISKNGIPPHTVTVSVTVNILDINDNPPLLTSLTGYVAALKEGTIGQVINTVSSYASSVIISVLSKDLGVTMRYLHRLQNDRWTFMSSLAADIVFVCPNVRIQNSACLFSNHADSLPYK